MPSARLVQIPYCYPVHGIQHRHRNSARFLLRGSVPAEITVLTVEEAPVKLRARLVADGHLTRSNDMELRHDGKSYLRAVEHMPSEAGGTPTPFTSDDFVRMLAWESTPWPSIYGDTDKPSAFLTLLNPNLREWLGTRQVNHRPEDLPTAGDLMPRLREIEINDDERARSQALHAAAEYVLINDQLYRRVAAPVAVLTEKGYPYLFYAEQFAEKDKTFGVAANWMPIAYAHLIPEISIHESARNFICEVDAPLENDDRRNLAYAIATAAPQVARHLALAVADMTEAGMSAYRGFRESYARAREGDLEACLELHRAMKVMMDDPSFGEAEETLNLRRLLAPKLEFLDAMARRSGLVLSTADEAALERMAV